MQHIWGDDWKHWETLYKAQNWLVNQMELNGAQLMTKEKYGTLRYEHIFRGQAWDLKADWESLYNLVKVAVDEWPEIEDELMEDMASNDEIVGKTVHDKYWRTIE